MPNTNMSEMSGVVSAKDLAKKAKEFGHEAIAVTDFGVVHSFPLHIRSQMKILK